MDQDQKEYFEDMLDERASFTKTDYKDAITTLMGMLDTDLNAAARSNMSRHITNLKNQMTAEQIWLATDGAAGPLLNARDQYNRAEAWMAACKAIIEISNYSPEYDTGPPPDYKEADRLLKVAEELEKD